MNDITRAEIDARFEANEARRDAMYIMIMGKLDMLIERLEAQRGWIQCDAALKYDRDVRVRQRNRDHAIRNQTDGA